MINDRTIIGIDPGTLQMGYGVLSVRRRIPSAEAMGVLILKKEIDPYDRLRKIYEVVHTLVEKYQPHDLVVEAPFFGKNVQSMLKLGRAQGVVIAAGLSHTLSISEYSPMEIKRAVTGSGRASKEQVAEMLRRMLLLSEEAILEQLDATDGLAVAFCHFVQLSSPLPKTKSASWEDFVKKNPQKIHQR